MILPDWSTIRILPRRYRSGVVVMAMMLGFAGTMLCADRVLATESDLVPMATNLNSDGAAADRGHRVLVLMLELPDCRWCDYLLSDEIEPTIRSGEYAGKSKFLRIDMSSDDAIIDFDDTETNGKELARRYEAQFSPTLVFVNGHGEIVADSILGISSKDFFGHYLDKALTKSIKATSG